jgi:uracil-DNA glycosylase
LSEPHGDARGELSALARQAYAWLEWLEASGAEGVPRGAVSRAAPELQAPAVPRVPTQPNGETTLPAPTRPEPTRPAPTRQERAPAAPAKPKRASPAPAMPPPPTDRADALARLAALEHEVAGCVRCPLHLERTQTVFARGSASAELAFVGEGPGADEDAQGLPFVGAAGQLLDRMIVAMGYERDGVYICNVVKCRPPGNRKPTAEEMAACAPYLHEQLALVSPQVLVALGATAVQGLLDLHEGGQFGPSITRLRGTWKLYRGRVPVMPTFHPAYLLRSPDKKRDVWSDLQSVMRRLGKGPVEPSRGRDPAKS